MERGYDTRGMKLEEMRALLADHDDFKNEICRVEEFLSNAGHTYFVVGGSQEQGREFE